MTPNLISVAHRAPGIGQFAVYLSITCDLGVRRKIWKFREGHFSESFYSPQNLQKNQSLKTHQVCLAIIYVCSTKKYDEKMKKFWERFFHLEFFVGRKKKVLTEQSLEKKLVFLLRTFSSQLQLNFFRRHALVRSQPPSFVAWFKFYQPAFYDRPRNETAVLRKQLKIIIPR